MLTLLTTSESKAWADRAGFAPNASFGKPLASELSDTIRFLIPEDTGARVALAKVLWESTGALAPETLVWVTECGVWPSGEHMPLAEAARRGLGAQRSLLEAPGHLIRSGEDAGLSVLLLAILFLWDCWVIPSGPTPAVFISHDEYGVVDLRHGDGGLRPRLMHLGVVE